MNKKKKILIGAGIASGVIVIFIMVAFFVGGFFIVRNFFSYTGEYNIYGEYIGDSSEFFDDYDGLLQEYLSDNYSEIIKEVSDMEVLPQKNIGDSTQMMYYQNGNTFHYGYIEIEEYFAYYDETEETGSENEWWYSEYPVLEYNSTVYEYFSSSYTFNFLEKIYELTGYEASISGYYDITSEETVSENEYSLYGLEGISTEYALIVKNHNIQKYGLYILDKYTDDGSAQEKNSSYVEERSTLNGAINLFGMEKYTDSSKSSIEITMLSDEEEGSTLGYYPDDITEILNLIIEETKDSKYIDVCQQEDLDYTFKMRMYNYLLQKENYIYFDKEGKLVVSWDEYARDGNYRYSVSEDLYKKVLDYVLENYSGEKIYEYSVNSYGYFQSSFVYVNQSLLPENIYHEYIQFNRNSVLKDIKDIEVKEPLIDTSEHKLLQKSASTFYAVRFKNVKYNDIIYQCVGIYNDTSNIGEKLGQVSNNSLGTEELNDAQLVYADVHKVQGMSESYFIALKYEKTEKYALYAAVTEEQGTAEGLGSTGFIGFDSIDDLTDILMLKNYNDYDNFYAELKLLYNDERHSKISQNHYYCDDAVGFISVLAGNKDATLNKVTIKDTSEKVFDFYFYHPVLESYINYSYIPEGENTGMLQVSIGTLEYAYLFDTTVEDAYNTIDHTIDNFIHTRVE